MIDATRGARRAWFADPSYRADTMTTNRASGRAARPGQPTAFAARLAVGWLAVSLLASACTPPDAGRVGGLRTSSGGAGPSVLTPTGAADGSPAATSATGGAFSAATVDLRLDPIAGGFDSPVFVTGAGTGDGRLYVVEQGGRIRVVGPDGSIAPDPFLDISGRLSAGGERGLLGLAFHPSYASDGRFYVDYTDTDGNTVISEMRRSAASPLVADPASERVLLRIDQPYPNHNGGMLAFGPDGDLYVGMGDGGSGGDPEDRARDTGSLLGKILRIDVDHPSTGAAYGIPATNPYASGAGGRPEIWARGVRNPWRFSFDRTTGDLWIGDVGQSSWEEVDRLTAAAGSGRGAHLGWRLVEGRACYDPPAGCEIAGLTAPIAVYGHDAGCAVTGGYVYRGATSPALAGAYLFGDYCSGRIWALDAAGPDVQEPALLLESGHAIATFGQGDDGELYVADVASGELFHVVATAR